jgi:hypothetical protein
MILKPLKFEWQIFDDDDRVEFRVYQDPLHVIHEEYYAKGKFPPINKRAEFQRILGTSPELIKKMVKNYIRDKKNSEKNQRIVDEIFSKFNVKPATSKPKKALKSVKKL